MQGLRRKRAPSLPARPGATRPEPCRASGRKACAKQFLGAGKSWGKPLGDRGLGLPVKSLLFSIDTGEGRYRSGRRCKGKRLLEPLLILETRPMSKRNILFTALIAAAFAAPSAFAQEVDDQAVRDAERAAQQAAEAADAAEAAEQQFDTAAVEAQEAEAAAEDAATADEWPVQEEEEEEEIDPAWAMDGT